jgi:O-antigen/teichoic acid export membrane protein
MTVALASFAKTANRTGEARAEASGLALASIGPLVMRALGTALGFLVSVGIGRRLGDEVLGAYAVGTGVMLVGAAVSRVGQDIELTRLIAAARAGTGETPWNEVAGVLRTVARTGTVLAVGAAAVAIPVGVDGTIVMGLLAIPGVAVVGSLTGVARGLGRPAIGVALDATIVPLGTLPMILLADNSTQALAGHGVVWAAVALTGMFVVLRRASSATPVPLRSLVRVGGPLAGLAALNIALATIDVVAVSLLRGDADAGRYAAAARLAFISTSVLVVANAVLQPRIAALWELDRREALVRLLRTSTLMLAGVAVVVASTLVVGAGPLLSIFGDDFAGAVPSMRVLAIGQFVTLASGPVGAVLLMTGNSHRQIQATLIAVAVNVVADVVLISRYGVVGAAIATALALSCKNLLSAFWAWRVVGSGR